MNHAKNKALEKILFRLALLIFIFSFISLIGLYGLERSLIASYNSLQSPQIKDRHGAIISTLPNAKQQYSDYLENVPDNIKKLLLKKEDRYFYDHPGINPVSILRATVNYIIHGKTGGSSTLTQQLAKNLLGNEQDRTFVNKFKELLYTLSLETFLSKDCILAMYANTVSLGNEVQGFKEASAVYFGKEPQDLTDTQTVMLLASLSSPSSQNPWKTVPNKIGSENLAKQLGVNFDKNNAVVKNTSYHFSTDTNFELSTMGQTCTKTCTTTLDEGLTDKLRAIINKSIYDAWDTGARNAAVVVIKLPENELLAMVGSPDVTNDSDGQNINMAIQPRPIGSTAKPFIYLNAFEKGLRPYTLVDDREYKFPIATGYPLYPKNYDGTYQGIVSLHYALSNSLNVPTVKTLQYVGLNDFYHFLQNGIGFKPLQDLDTYQYGIALGGLEMDPLTLASFITLFPEYGVLKPLKLYNNKDGKPQNILPPMGNLLNEKVIADPKFTELVTKVLNDRKTGVEQFGLESNLNLPQDNYAVKTGTSRDYHDSWTVGYTPDFAVVVWFGNAKNTALKQVTGEQGAGKIWHDTMELLMNSEYNKKTPFVFKDIRGFMINNNIDYGLPDDVVSQHTNVLLNQDTDLITSPHADDTILLEAGTSIPLRSPQNVTWYSNDTPIGQGTESHLTPSAVGNYTIKATDQNGKSQSITIQVIKQ